MEGSGSGFHTNGSGCGSEGPKNIQILRIQIRNTSIELWEGIDNLIFALFSYVLLSHQEVTPQIGLYWFKDNPEEWKTARIDEKVTHFTEGPNDDLI
jgi:hypothetical protein